MKQRTRIEHPLAVVQKLIAAADEAGAPLAIRIDFHPLVARREHNCARRCVGNRDGVGEDALHALVGREGMALLDANRGEYSDYLWVEGVVRLVLDYGVDLLVEVKVVGVDRVEPLPR